MRSQQRIIAIHLLNDRSGSPKVLSQLLRIWVKADKEVLLYTSSSETGFLSDIEGVQYIKGWYTFKRNPWLRLIYYSLSQLILLVSMWRTVRKNDLVYINTILPFGAAIIGRMKDCRVIYHIHEHSINPPVLKWFLFKIVSKTADTIINVSQYIQSSHRLDHVTNHLVYNAIDDAFLAQVAERKVAPNPKHVLMVCSLKTYKGVFEFIRLADDNPGYDFRLVLNATGQDINRFFASTVLPTNLHIYPSQTDMHPHYQWADLIVNLSRPDGWVETFGLTIIEGMAYGLPAIVPPVGGILEVIKEGETGYSVDSRDREKLNEAVRTILSDEEKYRFMSTLAHERISLFSEGKMAADILEIVGTSTPLTDHTLVSTQ